MPTALPVRIHYQIPDGWRPASPDAHGMPHVDTLLVHPGSAADGFVANLLIAGEVTLVPVPLEVYADRMVQVLREAGAEVEVRERADRGTPDQPALIELLRTVQNVDGTSRERFKAQAYLASPRPPRGDAWVVLRFVLTANRSQFSALVDDFQRLVRSVRPVPRSDPRTVGETADRAGAVLAEVAADAGTWLDSGWTFPAGR